MRCGESTQNLLCKNRRPGRAAAPVPALADFVVEAVSNAFGRLPDPVLLPWLPTLITTLRRGGAELAPLLIREAGRIFPGQLPALDAWVPPWRGQPAPAAPRTARNAARGVTLLAAYPAACDAVAVLLGCDDPWEVPAPAPAGAVGRYPAATQALEALLPS